ncbi:MAG: hypothetical protein R8K21_03610 [Mariprofundales bacterium]
MPPVSNYVRSLDCAHKLRLRIFLHSNLSEAHLTTLANELEAEGLASQVKIERFSGLVAGAKDLGELRAAGLFASGALGGRELQVTFGKLGTASDPEAFAAFLVAIERTEMGPLALFLSQGKDSANA